MHLRNHGGLLIVDSCAASMRHDRDAFFGLRIKAAVEALPYVHPKLAMVATANANGDFGTMLERAIEASKAAREPLKIIEARTQPTNGHHPSPNEVSSARMGKSFSSLKRRA
jgi:hypothetical protein